MACVKSYKSPADKLRIFWPDALPSHLLWRHLLGLGPVLQLEGGDTYLLFDVLNLRPQPLDHPVELCNLTLGVLQVVTILVN